MTQLLDAFWHEWRGSLDGRPTMLIRRLIKWRAFRVDLHCFIASDDPGCYHTHPRWSWRLVLWGGYIEELESGARRLWWPGRFGFVAPHLSHRVAAPIYRRSYSLWIRLPTPVHEVELRGDGWKKQERI